MIENDKEAFFMKLGIVGTGAMGRTLRECAEKDEAFSEIAMIEPLDESSWPAYKTDLLIDFSNPKAILDIYEYCRKHGGNIPVVLATTGYSPAEEEIIRMIAKICPIDRKTNYSQGIAAMNELAKLGRKLLEPQADIRLLESHHTHKKDAPSGTCKTLCDYLGIKPDEYEEKVAYLRMGTVCGEHSIFFAMPDEVIEIKHTAYSKKIFAAGALEAGKKMLTCQDGDLGV